MQYEVPSCILGALLHNTLLHACISSHCIFEALKPGFKGMSEVYRVIDDLHLLLIVADFDIWASCIKQAYTFRLVQTLNPKP